MGTADVSFVVPAKDEEAYLGETLDSVAAQRTPRDCEVLVVDGDSDDATTAVARDRGARVVHQREGSIGAGRDLGARHAEGDYLAFVDADTVLAPHHTEALFAHRAEHGLAAVSSRCRIRGPRRALAMQAVVNRVFPRLERPILPGFNLLVDRETYAAAGGFPDVPNEDTAFSRRLGRVAETGYCPAVTAETSGRRIAESGLTGALWHYLWLDVGRLRADC